VDQRSISERVKELRQEIASIRAANDRYQLQEHHTISEIQEHTRRLERLDQILRELTDLTLRINLPKQQHH
jgi:hypothetical protein